MVDPVGAMTKLIGTGTGSQPGLLIVICPVVASAGTFTVKLVASIGVGVTAALLPNLTAMTPSRPVPLIVTTVPGAPLGGLMPVKFGQPGVGDTDLQGG